MVGTSSRRAACGYDDLASGAETRAARHVGRWVAGWRRACSLCLLGFRGSSPGLPCVASRIRHPRSRNSTSSLGRSVRDLSPGPSFDTGLAVGPVSPALSTAATTIPIGPSRAPRMNPRKLPRSTAAPIIPNTTAIIEHDCDHRPKQHPLGSRMGPNLVLDRVHPSTAAAGTCKAHGPRTPRSCSRIWTTTTTSRPLTTSSSSPAV